MTKGLGYSSEVIGKVPSVRRGKHLIASLQRWAAEAFPKFEVTNTLLLERF